MDRGLIGVSGDHIVINDIVRMSAVK